MASDFIEQISVISMIDESRRKKKLIGEYLDLPKRRIEIVEKLRQYYRERNIVVSDDVIEAAVCNYFDQRLRFQAPELAGAKALFATLYLSRTTWFKKTIIGFVGLLFLAGIVHESRYQYQVRTQEKLLSISRVHEQEGRKLNHLKEMAFIKLKKMNEVVNANKNRAAIGFSHAAKIEFDLGAELANGFLQKSSQMSSINDVNEKELASLGLIKIKDQIELHFAAMETKLNLVEKALAIESEFASIIETDAYQAKRKLNSVVENYEKTVATQLNNENDSNVVVAMEQFKSIIGSAEEIAHLVKEFDVVAQDFTTIDSSDVVSALRSSFKTSADALQVKAAAEQLSTLKKWREFYQSSFTMMVPDGVNRSGFERTLNSTKGSAQEGKSWFVVVEARKHDGSVQDMFVTNVETGKSAWLSRFSVRVPKEFYDKLKSEKKSTGHISRENRELGHKPSGKLKIDYRSELDVLPDLNSANP